MTAPPSRGLVGLTPASRRVAQDAHCVHLPPWTRQDRLYERGGLGASRRVPTSAWSGQRRRTLTQARAGHRGIGLWSTLEGRQGTGDGPRGRKVDQTTVLRARGAFPGRRRLENVPVRPDLIVTISSLPVRRRATQAVRSGLGGWARAAEG